MSEVNNVADYINVASKIAKYIIFLKATLLSIIITLFDIIEDRLRLSPEISKSTFNGKKEDCCDRNSICLLGFNQRYLG